MKVPFSWLKKHVKLTATPARIADDLVRLGHEVEGVEEPCAAVKGVRVGLIESKIPHPDADKLSLLKVNIGEIEPLGLSAVHPIWMRATRCRWLPSAHYYPMDSRLEKVRFAARSVVACAAPKRNWGLPKRPPDY